MSYLTINNVPIEIARNSCRRSIQDLGTSQRAIDGSLWTISNGHKSLWTMRTTPLSSADNGYWIQLLSGNSDGMGDVFTFEDEQDYGSAHYSWNGALIDDDSTTAAKSDTRAKYGSKSWKVTYSAGDTNYGLISMNWSIAVASSHTAAWWGYTDAWHHYVKTYDFFGGVTTKYKDGVSGATDDMFDGVYIYSDTVNTVVKLKEVGTADVYYDDLYLLPFSIGTTSTWPSYWDDLGFEMPPPPKFYCAGDFNSLPVWARIRVLNSTPIDCGSSIKYVLDLELAEI